MPTDPYLIGPEADKMSDDEFEAYQDSHYYPSCFLIPTNIINFTIIEKVTNKEKTFVTDNNIINIDGNNYYLYTYVTNFMKAQDFDQSWKYVITLN